ncbi:MarR family winged helix-turn-helix transcriptional regulator [Anaeroselena agilis]|uniref:MarR family transcriptional regulator n=1 Tax=Anaeroselena agilis TaxID=3063788 RepID=A0ABU3NVH5_9FIRM|nr:MarR family transcriptional regulator [Selenomonadales bacterium 4137-cl]
MEDRVAALRDAVKDFIRNVGLLEGKKSFCADCSYAQCHAVVEVGARPGISLGELAGRVRMDKSALSRVVDDLVRKGYITREQDPGDRRYVSLTLTADGEGLRDEIDERSGRVFAEVLAAIPETKRAAVVEGMGLLATAFKNVLPALSQAGSRQDVPGVSKRRENR